MAILEFTSLAAMRRKLNLLLNAPQRLHQTP